MTDKADKTDKAGGADREEGQAELTASAAIVGDFLDKFGVIRAAALIDKVVGRVDRAGADLTMAYEKLLHAQLLDYKGALRALHLFHLLQRTLVGDNVFDHGRAFEALEQYYPPELEELWGVIEEEDAEEEAEEEK